ncbi:MAG: hypothetical protein WCZ17_11500 [Candidatus Kapaibacterium sp.]
MLKYFMKSLSVFLIATGSIMNLYSNNGLLDTRFMFGLNYDSNPFLQNKSQSSGVILGCLNAEYIFPDTRSKIKYDAGIIGFSNFKDRSYYRHLLEIGTRYEPESAPYLETMISLNHNLRYNANAANSFDYFDVSGNLGFSLFTHLGIISLNDELTYMKFKHIEELCNVSNELKLNLEKNLESMTVIYVGLSYKSRLYLLTADTYTSNQVKKKYVGDKNEFRIEYDNSLNNLIQWDMAIEQYLNDNISIKAGMQCNFIQKGDGFYYYVNGIDLYNDFEFFDDVFNYDEMRYELSSKINIFNWTKFVIDMTHFSREYYSSISDTETSTSDIKRKDMGKLIRTELSFLLSEKYEIGLKSMYFLNDSNDINYDFNVISVMIDATVIF